jgi:DNA-binding HxlR family transcriptional regulator
VKTKGNRRVNNCNDGCPVEAALDMIGDKWKGVILFHLLSGTKRFGEIKRIIPDVSQRVLTKQLRELEEDSIVLRTVYPEVPPKVEYTLTALGLSLEPILLSLREWGEKVMGMKK